MVARVEHLDLPSYTGFVMPRLRPVCDDSGEIVDVEISYPLDLTAQMLEYSTPHRFGNLCSRSPSPLTNP